MYKYDKKSRKIKIFCPHCRENLFFQIPEEVFERNIINYPFTFRYIHGKPPHSVTLYIDKNDDIRSYEFGDAVKLSNDILDNMFEQRQLEEKWSSELILKSVFNTYTTVIEAKVPNADILNYEIGQKLGQKFENLFQSTEKSSLLTDLQQFWKRNSLGYIDDIKIEQNSIDFKVYECFECSHLPVLGYPVCKLDEGFLTAIFEKKYNSKYLVQEVECIATGKDYCQFIIQDISKSMKKKQSKKFQ